MVSFDRAVGDVRPSDLVLGWVVALLVLGSTVVSVARLEIEAMDEGWTVLAPGEIAVEVDPVTAEDLGPMLDDTALAEQDLATTKPTYALGGSTQVPPRPVDAPPPSAVLPERPSGGIRGLPRIEPAESRPLPRLNELAGFGRGGPAVAPGEADRETSPKDPYAYVDPAREDPAASGSGMVTDGEGAGEGDPLAARAVAAYRQRLQRWLSLHFFVTDSGLSREALAGAKIRATLEIDDDRIVVGHSLAPGGHPALRAAAQRALERVRGQPVPEPPQHYPGPLQRSISVTFTCTEETCS
jgi:hypothetical protein